MPLFTISFRRSGYTAAYPLLPLVTTSSRCCGLSLTLDGDARGFTEEPAVHPILDRGANLVTVIASVTWISPLCKVILHNHGLRGSHPRTSADIRPLTLGVPLTGRVFLDEFEQFFNKCSLSDSSTVGVDTSEPRFVEVMQEGKREQIPGTRG